MTISSATAKVRFNGNGATVAFPFTFKVFDQGDLTIIRTAADGTETTLTITTQYSVALNADQNNNPGGTVTVVTAPTLGELLTIVREIEAVQETDITNGGGFYPEVIENALDRLTMLAQQANEVLDRAFVVPITSDTVPVLPVPEAGKYLGWDLSETELVNYSPTATFTAPAYVQERQTALDGQTVFLLANAYVLGASNLLIFTNGKKESITLDYVETDTTTVTFNAGKSAGDVVEFYLGVGVTQASTDASQVGYMPSGTGAVATNVQTKLREFVSVKDFGAVGDGATDDTVAIQAAINAVDAQATNGVVHIPSGAYRITTALSVPYGVSIKGDGATASVIHCYGCDAISFTTYGTEIGSVALEDFGVTSASGSNYAGVVTLANASTMDGIYINRMRFYGWNECINFASNANCTVSDCVAQNINSFISVSGKIVKLNILNNRAVFASGGSGTADQYGVTLKASTYTESVHIVNNYFYGFDRTIDVAQCTFLNILHNDLSGAQYAISFVSPNGTYNICDNYIEVNGAGIGIFGAAQGSDNTIAQTNIQRNNFIGAGGAVTGIQLNTAIGTYQWNSNIRDNNFSGFATYDIQIYTPGRSTIENNRCLSNVTTNSLWLGGALAGPVNVKDNWLFKALYLDVAADVLTGKIILEHNTTANTFVPYSGTFTPGYGSTAGTLGAITTSYANGSYHRIGQLCWFNLTIVASAFAVGTASGLPLITNLPFTAAATIQATAVTVADAYGWGANTPISGAISAGTSYIVLDYKATANGATANMACTDYATGTGTLNRVSISGVYLCN